MLWNDAVGVKNITIIEIGMWPKTIAVSETYLLSSFFTIAFQTACKKAVKIIAKNTVVPIIRFCLSILLIYWCGCAEIDKTLKI